MIKAVIFDIDGVLLDSYEANFRFYCSLLEAAGYKGPTQKEFPNYFHMSMYDGIKAMTGLEDEDEVKRIWEMGRGKDNVVSYPVELLAMPDGCEKVMKKLAGKYKLGIVTSRIRESTYEGPMAKLRDLFDASVSYQDTENHKPHPEPLHLAAKKLGLKPEECVYIGDMPSDIKAANAARMKIILYSKDYIEGANAETADFKELPKLIEEVSQK